MDWEIADLEDKFSVDLTEREGKVTISSVTVNGNTHEFPEIRISKIGKNSTISLETESGTRLAHVKKNRRQMVDSSGRRGICCQRG